MFLATGISLQVQSACYSSLGHPKDRYAECTRARGHFATAQWAERRTARCAGAGVTVIFSVNFVIGLAGALRLRGNLYKAKWVATPRTAERIVRARHDSRPREERWQVEMAVRRKTRRRNSLADDERLSTGVGTPVVSREPVVRSFVRCLVRSVAPRRRSHELSSSVRPLRLGYRARRTVRARRAAARMPRGRLRVNLSGVAQSLLSLLPRAKVRRDSADGRPDKGDSRTIQREIIPIC